MEKVVSIVAVAALSVVFVSCGPSKDELEAHEKAKADSVAAVLQQRIDSLVKAVNTEPVNPDMIAAVAQAQADSLAKVAEAEATAAASKKR